MVVLNKIDKFTLPTLIRIAYEGDDDLLTKYHVDKFDINGAVASTLWMIEMTERNENKEMQHYEVLSYGEKIGYISTYPNMLYSFGINTKFRTGEVLAGWWNEIKNVLGDKFISMLYPNNTRAINFLKKQGMQEIEGIEDNCVTLLNI